jgi:hypothetical protein
MRAPCEGEPCINGSHDHFEQGEVASSEVELSLVDPSAIVPMTCHDCGIPTHYDYGDETYHHNDPTAAPCFLVS